MHLLVSLVTYHDSHRLLPDGSSSRRIGRSHLQVNKGISHHMMPSVGLSRSGSRLWFTNRYGASYFKPSCRRGWCFLGLPNCLMLGCSNRHQFERLWQGGRDCLSDAFWTMLSHTSYLSHFPTRLCLSVGTLTGNWFPSKYLPRSLLALNFLPTRCDIYGQDFPERFVHPRLQKVLVVYILGSRCIDSM